MSIPNEILEGVTRINVTEMRAALKRNGYVEEGQTLKTTEYLGEEDGKYKYTISYMQAGQLRIENVLVEIKQAHSMSEPHYYADF